MAEAAPAAFQRLGATAIVVGDRPDGTNINAGCGATDLRLLSEVVPAEGAHLGVAFDGDGDRMLAVDREGVVVDGDELIALAALHLRGAGRLPGDGVAVTVMTNYGFHQAMQREGISVATTPVGDRNVLVELIRRGWALGGEQSGHIIDTNFVPAGDGIASALLTMEALAGGDLAGRDAMRKLPQRLVNVRVADRDALERAQGVWAAVEQEETALEGRGRVLLRPSGTEPVVRVMVEAPDEGECEDVTARLVAAVERELGAP
jgi:phosphoglucosamine mutase